MELTRKQVLAMWNVARDAPTDCVVELVPANDRTVHAIVTSEQLDGYKHTYRLAATGGADQIAGPDDLPPRVEAEGLPDIV